MPAIDDEALRKQSEWLRITLSSIGDAVISTDAASRVTFLNAVAEFLTGWNQSEAVGRPLTEIFHIVNEHTRLPVENPTLQALQQGIVVGLANHTVLIARDGTERPIDDSAAPIRDGNSPPLGAVLVFRDVTERKRAEEIRSRLAAIVESSADAIVSKSLDGIIRTWNAGAERLFGYSPAEAVGRPITFIIPPERIDEGRTILEKVRAGKPLEHFETVRVAKDGRRLDIVLSVSPLRDEDGHIIGASKVARDITAQKQAVAERIQVAETLELALAAAELGTWDWDPTTDEITISDRTAKIFGLQPGQTFTREGMRARIRSDFRDLAREAARRSVAERSEYHLEYALEGQVWVSARGRGVYAAAGNLVRMLGVVQDITARKQDEAALRTSEDRHRFLAELANATQSSTEPAEVMAVAARLLAEHLAVDRCVYADVENESVFVVIGDHSRGVPSIAGRWPVSAFGTAVRQRMQANEPFTVDDVESDPQVGPADLPAFREAAVRSAICVPLHKNGKFSAALSVQHASPRHWTATEIEFVRLVAGRFWDALERARVARTLHETEARFRRLIAAGIIGVIRWDLDRSLIVDANDEFLRMSGYDREDLAAGRLNFRKMTPPEWTVRNELGIRELRETGVGGAYEKEYFRKDGGRVPVIIVGVRFEETTSEGMSFVLDITERKRADEALARITAESDRRRRLYETILSNTPDLIYVFGLDHRFTYANEALLNMWGKSSEEAIGKNCLELGYPAWHAAMHDREIEQVVATKRPVRGEVPFVGAFGKRTYDYIFVPVLGADGEVEAVAGTTRDVTERKQAEEDLKAADRKKDEFLALLAHELRNPLAPLRNGLQVMRLAFGNADTIDEARGMMERQLGHMVRLIDDLLDISRVKCNKMELRRSRVAIADIVKSAVETARPAIEEGGLELTISLPEDPVFLDADLTRLAQVFSNLLSNSAKYTERGGRIWLTVERQKNQVVASVRDTGIGIPADSLPRIFDMFSQVDRSIERSTGGLGIGLALVKGLVEMHEGTVTAASDGQGKGSIFTVTLPILGNLTEPVSGIRSDDKEPAAGHKRRILVVDDNRDSATSMALMLKLMGNEVRTAYDGIEAVELAEAFRPQLILMDVGMPRLNGLDATRRIRSQPWGDRINIVALTGWGQDSDRENSRQAGAVAHMVKPVSPSDLERVLAETWSESR